MLLIKLVVMIIVVVLETDNESKTNCCEKGRQ